MLLAVLVAAVGILIGILILAVVGILTVLGVLGVGGIHLLVLHASHLLRMGRCCYSFRGGKNYT